MGISGICDGVGVFIGVIDEVVVFVAFAFADVVDEFFGLGSQSRPLLGNRDRAGLQNIQRRGFLEVIRLYRSGVAAESGRGSDWARPVQIRP